MCVQGARCLRLVLWATCASAMPSSCSCCATTGSNGSSYTETCAQRLWRCHIPGQPTLQAHLGSTGSTQVGWQGQYTEGGSTQLGPAGALWKAGQQQYGQYTARAADAVHIGGHVQSTCGGSKGRAGSTQVGTAGAVHRGGGMASKQMGEAGAMQAAQNWGQQSRGRTGIFQGVAVVAAGNPAVAHRLSFCLESNRPHIAQHSTASPCTVTLSPWCRRGWLAAGHPGAQPCSTQRP